MVLNCSLDYFQLLALRMPGLSILDCHQEKCPGEVKVTSHLPLRYLL
jgi:hypothetical protein